MSWKLNRRELLKTFGAGAAAVILPEFRLSIVRAEDDIPVIKADSFYPRGQWFFDPAGLYIQKGQKVRWVAGNYGPTITAFHPSNWNHELRIPENAKPFDSGILTNYGAYNIFEWTFDVEGTYDYFARTFEVVGMVGRIVVGKPGGPAEQHPPGYGGREGRAVLFPAQAKILAALPSNEIVAKKTIPYPKDLVFREFPYGDLNR